MSENGGKRAQAWLRLLAWALLGLSIASLTGELIYRAQIPAAKLDAPPGPWPVDVVGLGFLLYAALGALVALRRPRTIVGWVFLIIGVAAGVNNLTTAYVSYMKLDRPGAQMIPAGLLWLPSVLWIFTYGLVPLLLFYFPTGRLLSHRWRPAIWAMAVGLACWLLIMGEDVQAGAHHFILPALVDLLGVDWLQMPLFVVFLTTFVCVALAGIGSIVLRFARARGDEKLQLKWFAYAGVVAVITNLGMQFFFAPLSRLDPAATFPAGLFWGIPQTLSIVILPAAAAVAVLRYRLYEIDIIIRKTLVYATLTFLLALVYTGTIIILESILAPLTGQRQSGAAIVISTLAIATLFTPLRLRVQDWIDRRFFRGRYNAEQVLARFSSAARNEVDLEQILDRLVGVVSETMQPEQVSLWLRPEGGSRTDGAGKRGI